MKKFIVLFVSLFLFNINVDALSVSGRSVILIDNNSKRILYSKDIYTKRLIASTTKIMTFVVAYQNGNLDDLVEVGDEVLSMYGTSIYLNNHEKITLRDLLYGLMLRSGNDAAVVIAKHVGGTIDNFVKMMNDKAHDIGMMNTVFLNPHGLDEETKNMSTAYDMALLSIYANNIPFYKDVTKTKKYSTSTDNKSYIWYNRNNLLFSYKYLTSGKTGYTPSAGKTFVSTAKKDNLDLTVVTLNDGNTYNTAKELYDYAFENYKEYLILDKNNFKVDDNFFKDKIYINESFSYPLTELEKDNIEVLIKINKLDNYKNQDKVGDVIVTLDDNEIYREDIFVKVRKKSLLKRIWSWFSD